MQFWWRIADYKLRSPTEYQLNLSYTFVSIICFEEKVFFVSYSAHLMTWVYQSLTIRQEYAIIEFTKKLTRKADSHIATSPLSLRLDVRWGDIEKNHIFRFPCRTDNLSYSTSRMLVALDHKSTLLTQFFISTFHRLVTINSSLSWIIHPSHSWTYLSTVSLFKILSSHSVLLIVFSLICSFQRNSSKLSSDIRSICQLTS